MQVAFSEKKISDFLELKKNEARRIWESRVKKEPSEELEGILRDLEKGILPFGHEIKTLEIYKDKKTLEEVGESLNIYVKFRGNPDFLFSKPTFAITTKNIPRLEGVDKDEVILKIENFIKKSEKEIIDEIDRYIDVLNEYCDYINKDINQYNKETISILKTIITPVAKEKKEKKEKIENLGIPRRK